jgi:predicted O-linked N-acetylglucosamine transferase (SPINDLY family)
MQKRPENDSSDPRALQETDGPADLLRLGRELFGRGQAQSAVAVLQRLVRLVPDYVEALLLLAEALNQAGRLDESLEVCRRAKAARGLAPDQTDVQVRAGMLAVTGWMFQTQGQAGQAETMFRQALDMDPDSLTAHLGLAAALFEARGYGEAGTHFAAAAALAPAAAEPLIGLSAICAAEGRAEEAVAHGRAAVALAPKNIEARLAQCMAHLRIIHDRPEQIEESRRAYLESLRELEDSIRLSDPAEMKAASKALGGLQPFYLAYQGLCDVEPQRVFGTIAARISAAAWPEHARPLPPPPLDGPMRIGIASAFIHAHSNWKMHIQGWLEGFDRQRFQIYCYHLGQIQDKITRQAKDSCHGFTAGPRPVEEFAALIKKDHLHALLYPEIGMHPLAFKLATMRLAPVQCGTWGHPETSGLPTMDYFLSSELMEPDGAEAHYTERLVRLPQLSTYYLPPEVPTAEAGRADFGLPENGPIYLCAQSLFKYLPQYDDIFPRIAREVPDCRFAFIDSQTSPKLTERFAARLGRAFARFGLDGNRHVVLVKRLSLAGYHALNRCCDVFLDSVGWSGCNSTLEALACGLPVLTLPSGLMRGRHSLAILSMIGHRETVAQSVEEYVSLAVRLGREPAWREELRRQVLADRSKAYADLTCMRALEEFLLSAAT